MNRVTIDDEGERLPDAFSLAEGARHGGSKVSGPPNASCSGMDDGLGGGGVAAGHDKAESVGTGAQVGLARKGSRSVTATANK